MRFFYGVKKMIAKTEGAAEDGNTIILSFPCHNWLSNAVETFSVTIIVSIIILHL